MAEKVDCHWWRKQAPIRHCSDVSEQFYSFLIVDTILTITLTPGVTVYRRNYEDAQKMINQFFFFTETWQTLPAFDWKSTQLISENFLNQFEIRENSMQAQNDTSFSTVQVCACVSVYDGLTK